MNEEIETLRAVIIKPPKFTLEGLSKIGVVIKVYDGDTVWVKVDMGNRWGVVRFSCRLYGYDTSEIRRGSKKERELGKSARDFVRDLIMNNTVMVHFGKYDKYGRPLIDLNIIDEIDGEYLEAKQTVNDIIVKAGHGAVYMGSHQKKNVQDRTFIEDGLTTEEIISAYKLLNQNLVVPSLVDRKEHYSLTTRASTFT